MLEHAHGPGRLRTRLCSAAPLLGLLLLAPLAAHAEQTPQKEGAPIENGLTEQGRAEVAKLLEARLRDEYALYTTTWNYHWNVQGVEFYQLHLLLDEQYKELAAMVDRLAEHIQALGFRADVMHAEYANRLKEDKGDGVPEDLQMIRALVAGQDRLVRSLRADAVAAAQKYGDIETENLLQDFILQHEKMAWMLRAHLGPSEEPGYVTAKPAQTR